MRVYSGEHHSRSKWRWLAIFGVLALVILLTLFYPGNNRTTDSVSWMQFFNTFAVLFFMGAYIWWIYKHDEQIVAVDFDHENKLLLIGSRTFQLGSIAGYVTEFEKKSGNLKNIVLLFVDRSHEIFSVVECDEGAYQELFDQFENYGAVRYDDYKQSFFQVLIRKLKL